MPITPDTETCHRLGQPSLDARLLVFARAPVAGQVKTRLIPALGAEGAARLYGRLAADLLRDLDAWGLAPVELWVTPDAGHPLFDRLAARWRLTQHRQEGEDLGARLAHAARTALTRSEAIVLLGTDCAELSADYLGAALGLLRDHDAVLGPALDGGYVLLGLRQVASELFEQMPWGSDRVADLTRRRLDRLGWRWRELHPLRDIDRPEDLVHLPPSMADWAREN